MKAVRIHTPGGPEALRHEDAPEPTPKPGEAVVKIDADRKSTRLNSSHS